jgi:hypothetical protein
LKRNPDAPLHAIAKEVGTEFAPRLRRAYRQATLTRVASDMWREIVRRAVARRILSRANAKQLCEGMAA